MHCPNVDGEGDVGYQDEKEKKAAHKGRRGCPRLETSPQNKEKDDDEQ